MARAESPRRFKQPSLLWALGLSLLAHAILGLWLHPIQFDTEKQKPPLTVELLKPEPVPPPQAATPPEPPKPEPPKPIPPKPQPEPKRPLPPKPTEMPLPSRPPEAPQEPRHESPPPPPAVITAAPKPEEPPPAFTAPPPPPPPPEPPRPTGPSEPDLEAARQSYGNALSREIAKYKRYPRIAQMRGWEGTVRLLLEIDSNGKVVAVRIEESSDREVFNTEALEMVKRMAQPPAIPEALRGRSFTVRVPIAFRLE